MGEEEEEEEEDEETKSGQKRFRMTPRVADKEDEDDDEEEEEKEEEKAQDAETVGRDGGKEIGDGRGGDERGLSLLLSHSDSRDHEIGTLVMGHSLIRSLVRPHR